MTGARSTPGRDRRDDGQLDRLLHLLTCPRCGAELRRPAGERGLLCTGCGQRYPLEPHLDLVAPGKRPPNEGPGDSAGMVRRRVTWERRATAVGSGERAALDAYVEAITSHLVPDAVVVDLGCGTGRVLREVGRQYDKALFLLGLDISAAMLDASYRILRPEPRAFVVRASTRRRLPLHDASVDVVLRRLAPALPDEVLRVLRPGGAHITFSFGPDHWRALYDALPDLPRPRAPEVSPRDRLQSDGFAGISVDTQAGHETIAVRDAFERLAMGPAGFHLDHARDLPRLHDLSVRQGHDGATIDLETEIVICAAHKPR